MRSVQETATALFFQEGALPDAGGLALSDRPRRGDLSDSSPQHRQERLPKQLGIQWPVADTERAKWLSGAFSALAGERSCLGEESIQGQGSQPLRISCSTPTATTHLLQEVAGQPGAGAETRVLLLTANCVP